MNVVLGIAHALLREGLRDALKRWGEVEVVGVCPSVLEAARAAERLAPDVLIISRGSRPAEDAQAVSAARQAAPRCRVVLLEDVGRSRRDDLLDADWRVPPNVGPTGLMKGLWRLYVGEGGVRPNVEDPGRAARAPRPLVTGREYEVLRAVCEGLSNKAVARQLGISEKTVKNHLSNVYRRTKVAGRTQLVLWAIQRGLGAGNPSSRT